MLSFHAQLKIFVATAPCDLRANFNGLWAAAQQRLGEDPKSGALFVFGNRRRNRIKLLYFDGTGVCVLAKRPVSHCPLEAVCETALSVSPAFSSGHCGFGNHWSAVRHARDPTAGWDAARDTGMDVRRGDLRHSS
jgi:hypothetical protein